MAPVILNWINAVRFHLQGLISVMNGDDDGFMGGAIDNDVDRVVRRAVLKGICLRDWR